MLKATKAVLFASLAALGWAAQANAATSFVVDTTSSKLQVSVTYSGVSGNSNKSGVDGTVTANVATSGSTISQIQITDFYLYTTQKLSVTLDYIFFTETASTDKLTLDLTSYGSAASVSNTGSFTQAGNAVQSTGDLDYSGLYTGTKALESTSATDISGTIVNNSGILTLTIPVSVTQYQTVNGSIATITITGTIIATAVPEVASLSILAAAPLMMLRRSRKI